MNISWSLFSPQGPLPPGDLLPHDVEDGGAHEAVLDGAREQEGGAALQQLVQCLKKKRRLNIFKFLGESY